MSSKNHSITNTRVYSDALRDIVNDVSLLCVHGLIVTPVRIPKSLVVRINKDADRDKALQEVKDGIATALNDYCLVGRWSEGVDDDKTPYIQFYLEPEKVEDEA